MVRSFLFIVALPALSACGSSSDAQLFGTGSSKDCSAGVSTACVGNDGCSARSVCSLNGAPGPCICVVEPSGSGGESSSAESGGAGGSLVGSGGDGAGGFVLSGSGGSSSGGSDSGGSSNGGSSNGGSPEDASVPPGPSCNAHSYTGSLTGPYRASAVLMATFTASIRFTVSEKGAIGGTLKGTSDASSEATLVGTMDCARRHVSIDITMGSYASFPLARTYVGTMTAELDPGGAAIQNGSWTITEPNDTTAGGSGTWTAQ
jgi:hypothetical protein